MLPPGLTAQPADRAHHQRLRRLHPDARTVVRLLVGACSCDLVRPRHADPLEDERHHRARHREARGTRDALLATLERHRRGAHVPAPPGGWPRALAAFVAEHARNAGRDALSAALRRGRRSAGPPRSGAERDSRPEVAAEARAGSRGGCRRRGVASGGAGGDRAVTLACPTILAAGTVLGTLATLRPAMLALYSSYALPGLQT